MIVGIAVATMVPSSDARNMPDITAMVVSTIRLRVSRDAYSVRWAGVAARFVGAGAIPRSLLMQPHEIKDRGCEDRSASGRVRSGDELLDAGEGGFHVLARLARREALGRCPWSFSWEMSQLSRTSVPPSTGSSS